VKKTILIILILFGLGVGGFFAWKYFFAPKEIYKGVWMPSFGASLIPDSYFSEGFDISIMEPVFADLDKAVEAGINTLAFQMGYMVNEQGELSLFPGEKEFIASFIDEAHARGIKIWLNPEIILQSAIHRGDGTTRIMPEELIVNTDLLKNFELAKFAEEHDVEIFSPSSEMYVSIDFDTPGRPRSLKLIAEIKPKIDAVYKGKICLRGEWPKPEFSEYSCFGPGVGAPRNEEERKKLIDQLDYNIRVNEKELIMGEIWEGNDWRGTPEEAKRNVRSAVEAVKGKVSGVFILDIGSIAPRFPGEFEVMIKELYSSFPETVDF